MNNTTEDALYQKYRLGTWEYRFTVPNGTYDVKLKFSEFSVSSVGGRLFNVAIEGASVENGFDIYKLAGKATALDRSYVTTVSDGLLTIAFTQTTGTNGAIVSAVEVKQR